MNTKLCPLCDSECNYLSCGQLSGRPQCHTIDCKSCGSFEITTRTIEELNDMEKRKSSKIKYKISALITEKNIHHDISPVIVRERNDALKDIKFLFTIEELLSTFPESPKEKLDKILLNIYKRHPKPGEGLKLELKEGIAPLFYSSDKQEAIFYLDSLREKGFLQKPPKYDKITAEGFDKIYELQNIHPEYSNSVFVALAFDHENAYYKAIQPTLIDFGFEPVCLLKNKSGESKNIDNEIMAGLRKAHFIVADLTNKNSGAYWEAGVGYGLGRPVILCCQEDPSTDKSKTVHFDLNHNTILFYKNFDELKSELKNWIEANGRIVIPKKR